jgi:hypothetical protein
MDTDLEYRIGRSVARCLQEWTIGLDARSATKALHATHRPAGGGRLRIWIRPVEVRPLPNRHVSVVIDECVAVRFEATDVRGPDLAIRAVSRLRAALAAEVELVPLRPDVPCEAIGARARWNRRR